MAPHNSKDTDGIIEIVFSVIKVSQGKFWEALINADFLYAGYKLFLTPSKGVFLFDIFEELYYTLMQEGVHANY